MCWGTERHCDLTTALLVANGACVVCGAVMYKMRPFHYCNAARDLIKKTRNKRIWNSKKITLSIWFSAHKTEENYSYQYMAAHTFTGAADTFIRRQSFKLLYVGTLKQNSSAFNCNSKWRDSSLKRSWHLSTHSQAPRDISESATIHVKTCLDLRWFRWRIFWVSVVNCGLIKNKDTKAMKLGMFTFNVLSLL
jgi:hypothetical protein